MKKKARLTALFVTLALLFAMVPAYGYTAGRLLPQAKNYSTAFADTKGTWCDSYAKTVYEVGLMEGKSSTKFDPTGSLTCAQITVITARLHDLLTGGDGKFAAPASGEDWYQPYLTYLQTLAADSADIYPDLEDALCWVEDTPYEPCNRYAFVWLLSAVLPDSALAAINTITALPDESHADVLAFYNAGILTGTNTYGTFNGAGTLNRGQAAAMLARLTDPSQRVKFTPTAFSLSKQLLGLDPTAVVMTIDGYSVSAELYASAISYYIVQEEYESSYGYYEKYANYFEEYWKDSNYNNYDTFADYLLAVYGIDVETEFAVQWNVADKAGMTPAQKVRSDALTDLKELAMLFNHASGYPLTAEQKTGIANDLAENRSNYYGYSDAYITETLSATALLTNISKKYAPSASQMSGYLAQSGYLYGRCIMIGYDLDGSEALYGRTKAEALSLVQTIRQQAASHLSDTEYFSYLAWKYSDDGYGYGYTDSGLIGVDNFSDADQTTLKNLAVGSLSAPLNYEESCDSGCSYASGYYAIFLKDDPSNDESVMETVGSIPAYTQLAAWAESAKVAATAAYDALDVSAIAKKYDTLSAQGLISGGTAL